MHHQLGRPRLEAVEQQDHARQEAGVALERNTVEPVGVPRQRGTTPSRCHAPGRGERRLLEERPPARRPGRERLERHPHDRHPLAPCRLDHHSPHAGQRMHVAMAVDVRHPHACLAQPGELGGAFRRDVCGVEPAGERARDERREGVEATGAGTRQAGRRGQRRPGRQVQV